MAKHKFIRPTVRAEQAVEAAKPVAKTLMSFHKSSPKEMSRYGEKSVRRG